MSDPLVNLQLNDATVSNLKQAISPKCREIVMHPTCTLHAVIVNAAENDAPTVTRGVAPSVSAEVAAVMGSSAMKFAPVGENACIHR